MNKKKKLELNKEVIANLDKAEMASLKGGFTYTLSLGKKCIYSKSIGAADPYTCGARMQMDEE
jgi:natural product precursor